MQSELWKPFSSEVGPTDPEYYFQENPGITTREAFSSAFWTQLAGDAGEMWEHLQYLQSQNPDSSPYYTSDSLHDQERRVVAPLLLKFVHFIQSKYPNVPEIQQKEALRTALYVPGILDLIQLIDKIEEIKP
jgi:hypothetical protein